MEQDDILKLAAKHYPTFYSMGLGVDMMGFERGYELGCKLTKETLFTEEQVIEIVRKSRETGLTAEYIILSLKEHKKN
jgi:hypothetical protein